MIELRSYQLDGLNALWDYFQSGKTGNPLLCWPTGTGKSIAPAIFIKETMRIWPNQRFMLLCHVSELIKQNSEVLLETWPEAPLGIYSAGLKQKDVVLPIIFAGIQSAIKNPALFGHRDIIFIDEAHLLNQDESSMYQTFLATMRLLNPYVKVIGMTATPFRMGQGWITDGGLFTDIVHDLTGMNEFNKLIDERYLAPLIPLRTKMELDIIEVGINKGEFVASQLQSAVDKKDITYAGLREFVHACEDRKSWLLFASGIEHAEHIAEMLGSFGVDCAAVHSKQKSDYNDMAITAFKEGSLRSIVNYGKLTTGFNHPGIDAIGMFRPTLSVPLWVQMLGRGTRPAVGKSNCLVMDFAKNTPRLGPINDPLIPRKKGEKEGTAPIKICDSCGAYNHASVRFCCQCGNEFEFKIKIFGKSGTDELIRSDAPIIEEFNVDYVIYARKQKVDKISKQTIAPPYIMATYFCGLQSFKEFVFPENTKYTRPFKLWWKQRHATEPPRTTDQALLYISQLRKPSKIKVWVNKKYPEIREAMW